MTALIQYGRDREAAALGSERLRQMPGGPMDPLAQLDAIVPLLDGLVAPLDRDQLALDTPCTNFSVRQVLEHMIGGATMFAAAFRGQEPPAVAAPDDPVASFAAAMADLRSAVAAPGAYDRTVASPFGDMPGETFARLVALDGLVHGWDIATATGQPYDPPDDVVAAVEVFARQALTDDLRDGDTFAAVVEVVDNAPALIRLVAFTGRRID